MGFPTSTANACKGLLIKWGLLPSLPSCATGTVNHPSSDPNLALLDACEMPSQNDALEAGKLALGRGANPESMRGARFALIEAVAHGNLSLAKAILDAGFTPDKPDPHGFRALDHFLIDDDLPACARPAGVEMLLLAGASPGPRQSLEPSPVEVAAAASLDECAALLCKKTRLLAHAPLSAFHGTPALASLLALGCPLASQACFEQSLLDPDALFWMRAHSQALCLSCLGSSNPRHWRAKWSACLLFPLVRSPDKPCEPESFETALDWISTLPGYDSGGSPLAFDGDPATEALHWAAGNRAPFFQVLAELGADMKTIDQARSLSEREALKNIVPDTAAEGASQRL